MNKRINFDDDLVLIKNETNNDILYKGMEDYSPFKNDDWRFDEDDQKYYLESDSNLYSKELLM